MTLSSTLTFITHHPLTKRHPLRAIMRFAHWQIASRLQQDITISWIDGAKLRARRGMTGLTGNIYCGLHEFEDMAFVLHLLRPGDLFVDVGANVGTYTVLASAVCGADCVSFEPDAGTRSALNANLVANGIQDRVEVVAAAVGESCGTVHFTVGRDTTNRVLDGPTLHSQVVDLTTIDNVLGDRAPIAMKLDVEGFESPALAGAVAALKRPGLLAVHVETADVRGVGLLDAAGFQPAAYDPWSRTLTTRSTAEPALARAGHNALFIRDLDACQERLATAPHRLVLGQLL